MTLQDIIANQKDFQRAVGIPIDSIKESDRHEMAERYLFKAIEEIVELRKEFPSIANPWSKEQKMGTRSRIMEELSDVMLFMMNFCIAWDITPDDLLKEIETVQLFNFESLKKRKMDGLNKEILGIPGYVSGIGAGNLTPDYIFVGQNPAKTITHGYKFWTKPEDGSSKALLPVLEKIGGVYYFTNLIKCVTPENREPTTDEFNYWVDIYNKEIEILKLNNPNVKVVAMGNWVADHIAHDIKIQHPATVLYGKPQEIYDKEVEEAIAHHS